MRILESRRFMTIKAGHSLPLLKNDIGRVGAILDPVAGSTSQCDCRMNVISSGVVGMALQAI